LCVCDSSVKQIPIILSRSLIMKAVINQFSAYHRHCRHPTSKKTLCHPLYTLCAFQ
jgi:hypothetical protein